MLVKYMRDDQNRPFGAVVAISKGKVGFSLCNPETCSWNKELGVKIAAGRARACSEPYIGNCVNALTVFTELSKMKDRAKRYFQEQSVVGV